MSFVHGIWPGQHSLPPSDHCHACQSTKEFMWCPLNDCQLYPVLCPQLTLASRRSTWFICCAVFITVHLVSTCCTLGPLGYTVVVKFIAALRFQSLMRRPAMTHEPIRKLLSAKQCGHLCVMPTSTELFKKVGTCCFLKSLKYREAGITWNLRCLHISSQMHVHIAPCPHSLNAMSPNYKIGRYLCQTSPPPLLNHTGAICQRILPNGANKTTHRRTVISLDVPKKVNKANDLSKSDYGLIS